MASSSEVIATAAIPPFFPQRCGGFSFLNMPPGPPDDIRNHRGRNRFAELGPCLFEGVIESEQGVAGLNLSGVEHLDGKALANDPDCNCRKGQVLFQEFAVNSLHRFFKTVLGNNTADHQV